MSTAIFLDQAEEVDRREARLLGLAFAFLALTALGLLLAPVVRSADWSTFGSRWLHFIVMPIWVGGVWIVRRELRRARPERDPILFPLGFLLAGWGMLLIWRLAPAFGARQTVWFLVSVAVMVVVLRGPTDLRWLRRYRYLWLTAGVTLTTLTLFLGINPSGSEPRLWLGCCGLYFQPSEPLRLFLISFLASFLADRLAFQWADRSPPWLHTLAPLLVVWGLSVALLVVQRDLGTSTLFLAILAVLLYLVSNRWQIPLIAGGFTVLGGVLGNALFDVVRVRLQSWLNPWADPIGGSYQVVQSLISVASGGVFGRGPGLGSPGFVPVVHSDFVFAAITEEWGLLGGLGLISLFAVLVARGLRTASRCRDYFTTILAAGLAVAMGLQAVLIIAGTIRMLPLTGVTLPFVSYGGSSLVTSFIALAFLLLLSGGKGGRERFASPLQAVQKGMILAWVGLALVLGWWSVFRAPALTSRSDNPRRGLAQKYSLRGRILDDGGNALAESIGERGEYSRVYLAPWVATVVGFNSLSYGLSGVEDSMDLELRGEVGYAPIIIWREHLLFNNPPAGLDVRLTIDIEAQRESFNALLPYSGAVVILDASSGDIKALVSLPSFDPNHIDTEWSTLVSSEEGPLLNRGTQGLYQPGMAFAPFVLAWAIEKGEVKIEDQLSGLLPPTHMDGEDCGFVADKQIITAIDLTSALLLGCPSPFAELGLILGAESLSEMIRSFGLDQPIALRLESAEAREFTLSEDIQSVRQAAVGQGELTVTPLQMARAFSALVGEGKLPALKLVDAVQDPDGDWRAQPSLNRVENSLSRDTSQEILRALQAGTGEILGFSTQALSGSIHGSLAWFLGADMGSAEPRIIVVVIEDGMPSQARSIGMKLLIKNGSSSLSP